MSKALKNKVKLNDFVSVKDFGTPADAIAASIGNSALLFDNTADVLLTVGAGGNFSTINAALEQASKMRPLYKNGGATFEIRLLAGFVMAEQVFVTGMDMSFARITSVDAEVTIQRSALTLDPDIYGMANKYPAFCARKGGRLPVIDVLFNMDTSGVADSQCGIILVDNGAGIVRPGKGVKNAPSAGLVCYHSSTAVAMGGIFTGSAGSGIAAWWGSSISADGANVSGSYYGVAAARGSTISFVGGIADDCTRHAVRADEAAFVNCYQASCQRAAVIAIYAWQGSIIQANSVNASYAGSSAVQAYNGSTVVCRGANLSHATVNGIEASAGSTVDADPSFGDVGACNVSYAGQDGINATRAATVSANGIIANNCTRHGIRAEDGSRVHAQGANVSAAGNSGFTCADGASINAPFSTGTGCLANAAVAAGGSTINVEGSTLTGAATVGIYSIESNINARNANGQKGGSPVSSDIQVIRGGIITANGSTGGTNVTVNTISASGIIFK